MILAASVGLSVSVAMAASAGLAIRAVRRSFRPVPVRHFVPWADPVAITQTEDQRALRMVTVTDRRGREWVMPADPGACGVCASIGGHLPQCPAAEDAR